MPERNHKKSAGSNKVEAIKPWFMERVAALLPRRTFTGFADKAECRCFGTRPF
jgi:hypothetical protein